MSCVQAPATFRLLDARVGWEPASCEGLRGCDGEAGAAGGPGTGLRLAPAGGGEGPDRAELLPFFGDRRLARGCGPCDWFLLAAPPAPWLLRRDGCTPGWRPLWAAERDPGLLVEPVAIAFRAHLLAVADRGGGRVLVFAREGEVLRASIPLPRESEPEQVALAPWGEVLVVLRGSGRLLRFGLDGEPRGATRWRPPPQVTGVAFGRDPAHGGEGEGGAEPDRGPGRCPVLLLTEDAAGGLALWCGDRDRDELAAATVAEVAALVAPTGPTAASELGFCLAEPGPDGIPVSSCWSWTGDPLVSVTPPGQPRFVPRGQLLTGPLDSGIPRCAWHRVRVDADVPEGTLVEIAVATSEDDGSGRPAQGAVRLDPGWEAFAPGLPHPDDWQVAPGGALDFLVLRPAGRHLFARVRLSGDGNATPLVRQIRLAFPRVTSLEHLPTVYRQDPAAADFTARFLSLFDAVLDDLDRLVERYPALLDVDGVPDAVLPWLAGLVGLTFDSSWSAERRRALLRSAPELYRRRGTPAGLRLAVRQVFGVDPVVEELGRERSWGALGRGTTLGTVRLFGSARARFRLGASALSRAPIRSLGDPGTDASGSGAYRLRVHLPPTQGMDVVRLERLVANQTPAHTVAEVRVADAGFVVGGSAVVGADTTLVAPPAPVLGGAGAAGNVRLRRATVLWPGRHGRGPALRVGDRSVVGVHTAIG